MNPTLSDNFCHVRFTLLPFLSQTECAEAADSVIL